MEQEKKDYEISFLLKTAESESEVIELLNKYQPEILNKSQISEIRLAYPIKKHISAYFGFYQLKALPEDVGKISSDLKLKSNILRFLVVKQSAKNLVVRSMPTVKPSKPIETEAPKPKLEALSNELLEKKLKEILK